MARQSSLMVDIQEEIPNARAVHIAYRHGAWHLTSEDGEVGGVFVSHDAARHFAEREFHDGQGRPVLDDGKRPRGDAVTRGPRSMDVFSTIATAFLSRR